MNLNCGSNRPHIFSHVNQFASADAKITKSNIYSYNATGFSRTRDFFVVICFCTAHLD